MLTERIDRKPLVI